MQIPTTRYVNRRGKAMAYQAFGAGPRALVVCHEIIGHLDLLWTDPVWVQQAARLGRHCRVLSSN